MTVVGMGREEARAVKKYEEVFERKCWEGDSASHRPLSDFAPFELVMSVMSGLMHGSNCS
jgi:hypothetical protein